MIGVTPSVSNNATSVVAVVDETSAVSGSELHEARATSVKAENPPMMI
jgi:hypothetical protein